MDIHVETLVRVSVNGETIETSLPFAEVVKQAALNAGYSAFRVLLNGVEVWPEEAPSHLTEGDVVETQPYDKAG